MSSPGYYRWNFLEPSNPQIAFELSKLLGIDPLLCRLLVLRGVETYEQSRVFFRPSISDLHDPFSMADMQKAVMRLSAALSAKEKIMIFGDYDVDGTTSVALLYTVLQTIGADVVFHVPDRYTEGYGVSQLGIDRAIELGCTLMITLDCGIKAHSVLKYAASKALDVVVCDHHEPDSILPEAFAVLDPKRNDCTYPYKNLSGCGVGFKLLQGLFQINAFDFNILWSALDLVAISIAADIVPITGENRVLCALGLQQLNQHPRAGIAYLMALASVKPPLSVSQVVFTIAPRINAAGRMKHAQASVALLIATNIEEAEEHAKGLQLANTERKASDQQITQEALELIENQPNLSELYSTVLYQAHWHKGVIGIVASRCIEKYYKPTIILTKTEKGIAGSARSVSGFDLYAALETCASYLEQFGGHTHAAGLSLREENLLDFQQAFEKVAKERISEVQRSPVLHVDALIEFKHIRSSFLKIIHQMEPFGPGNAQPLFCLKGVEVQQVRILKDQHLKLWFAAPSNTSIEGIFFNATAYFSICLVGSKLDVLFHLEENVFNDRTSLQLRIKDVLPV